MYSNNTGVEVRVPGFGNTNTVEFLDYSPPIPYFNTFVDYFDSRGYERGDTIRAVPYDWRLAGGKSTLGHILFLGPHSLLLESMPQNKKIMI